MLGVQCEKKIVIYVEPEIGYIDLDVLVRDFAFEDIFQGETFGE